MWPQTLGLENGNIDMKGNPWWTHSEHKHMRALLHEIKHEGQRRGPKAK